MWHQAPNEMKSHLQARVPPETSQAGGSSKGPSSLHPQPAPNTSRALALRGLYSPRWGVAASDWVGQLTGGSSGLARSRCPCPAIGQLLLQRVRQQQRQVAACGWLGGSARWQNRIGQAWVLLDCDWWQQDKGDREVGGKEGQLAAWDWPVGCAGAWGLAGARWLSSGAGRRSLWWPMH